MNQTSDYGHFLARFGDEQCRSIIVRGLLNQRVKPADRLGGADERGALETRVRTGRHRLHRRRQRRAFDR
jgi:hypothetical protein